MTTDPLAQILKSAEAVLFDFDGPICSVFDGYPAAEIARELLELAQEIRGELPVAVQQAASPHEVLLAAAADEELAHQLEAALQKAELTAIETARPTPGAAESIAACIDTGRIVAVVSNNYSKAVTEYLAKSGLAQSVSHVEGRNPIDPTLMKPNPHLIHRAIGRVDLPPAACLFVGDQTTDIEAGRTARVSTIGYANKPGKVETLRAAGADAIIKSMLDLARAIRNNNAGL